MSTTYPNVNENDIDYANECNLNHKRERELVPGKNDIGDKEPEIILPDNESCKEDMDIDSDDEMESVVSFDFDSDDEMKEADEFQSTAGTISSQFDVNLISDSIQRAESVLEQVENKNVVLVVGKTGTKNCK